MVLPILGLIALAGIASHLVQTGGSVNARRVAPDIARLSPLAWWKRVFSVESISSGTLAIPKTACVVAAAIVATWYQRDRLLALPALEPAHMVRGMSTIVCIALASAGVAMLATSIVDYAIARFSYFRRLRMTDQQLRDEFRMLNARPANHRKRHLPSSRLPTEVEPHPEPKNAVSQSI
jgi:flagellar biosynthetic protein FlhB